MAARITTHQRATLHRLARMSEQPWKISQGGWVNAKDCGGPAALGHLHRKGYVEREVRIGPHGGEHFYYRPAGWTVDRTLTAIADRARLAELRAS